MHVSCHSLQGMPSTSAGVSAVRTRARRFMAIREERHLPCLSVSLDQSDRPWLAAAVPPPAAGAFRNFVADDSRRIFAFDRLNRCVERIGHGRWMASMPSPFGATRTVSRRSHRRPSVLRGRCQPSVTLFIVPAAARHAFGSGAGASLQACLGVACTRLDVSARNRYRAQRLSKLPSGTRTSIGRDGLRSSES